LYNAFNKKANAIRNRMIINKTIFVLI